MDVEGIRPPGRPKKLWMEVVESDMKDMGLKKQKVEMPGEQVSREGVGERSGTDLPRETWKTVYKRQDDDDDIYKIRLNIRGAFQKFLALYRMALISKSS